jgi:hypothetical protein
MYFYILKLKAKNMNTLLPLLSRTVKFIFSVIALSLFISLESIASFNDSDDFEDRY